MKPVLSFFLFGVLLLCCCKKKEAIDPLGKNLSVASMKKDFVVFRNILETAHPSLTLYKNRQQVGHLFDSVYSAITASSPLRDFYSALFFITNELGCSHTDVLLPDHIYDTLQNRKLFFPYPVLWVENKLLVNITGHDLPEGTQIVSINETPAYRLLTVFCL